MTASRHVDEARRLSRRLARKGGAVVARRLMNRKSVRSELSPAPKDSGLQSVGDKGLPILGHALTAAALGIEFLENRLETYGEISWMRGLAIPFVLAFGPEAAQEVLANNDHVFSQKGQELFLGRFFTRGLMLLDFEEHHFHRRIMQEAFTRERLGGYLHAMDTIGRAAAASLSEDELLVYPYLKRTLLDIATVVFMGDEPGPQSDLMNKAFTDCLRASAAAVRFPVPGLRWSAGVRGRRALEEHFHTNIDARRNSGGDDLFAALCRVRDEDGNQFTDDDVVNHMIFLMSAATDTSAAAATAVLHQLRSTRSGRTGFAQSQRLRLATGYLTWTRWIACRRWGWSSTSRCGCLPRCQRSFGKPWWTPRFRGTSYPHTPSSSSLLRSTTTGRACGPTLMHSIPSDSATHVARTDRTVLPSCRSARVHTSASGCTSRQSW